MRIKAFVMSCIALILNGCATWKQPSDLAIMRDNGKSGIPVADLAKKPEFANLHRLAALSASIYIDNAPKSTSSFTSFCESKSKDIQLIPENWHQEHPLKSSSYSAVPILINWETGYPISVGSRDSSLSCGINTTRPGILFLILLKILEKNMATMFPSRPPVIL